MPIGWRSVPAEKSVRHGDDAVDADLLEELGEGQVFAERAPDGPCRRHRRSRRCRRSRRRNCSSARLRCPAPSARTRRRAASGRPQQLADRGQRIGPLGEQEGHRGLRPDDQLRRRPAFGCGRGGQSRAASGRSRSREVLSSFIVCGRSTAGRCGPAASAPARPRGAASLKHSRSRHGRATSKRRWRARSARVRRPASSAGMAKTKTASAFMPVMPTTATDLHQQRHRHRRASRSDSTESR